MTQIRTGVEKVNFGPFGAPSDPSGPNFHMREWWPMGLNHNRKRFRPFSAKSNHSNSIRSRKKSVLGHFGQVWASSGKPMGKSVTINTVTVFLSWSYIIIQKIIRNGQAVLEIFKFEKSSNLIGLEHFGP